MENINTKIKIAIIAIAVICIVTIGVYMFKRINNKEDDILYSEENILEEKDIEEKNETITVHITGEVEYPGVVVLNEGARLIDAIEAAGGEKEEADLNKLNLAYILNDGEKIYVPNKNDDKEDMDYMSSQNSGDENSNKIKLININTATTEELTKLPGVGESIANKIIAYRIENGKFKNIEEIKDVPGIGDSKYNNIKEMITIK